MQTDTTPPTSAVHSTELTGLLLANSHLSVWEALRRSAERFDERPAIVDGDRRLSYGELTEAVLRCAACLEDLGISKGTVVSYLLSMSLDWAVLHYALHAHRRGRCTPEHRLRGA